MGALEQPTTVSERLVPSSGSCVFVRPTKNPDVLSVGYICRREKWKQNRQSVTSTPGVLSAPRAVVELDKECI